MTPCSYAQKSSVATHCPWGWVKVWYSMFITIWPQTYPLKSICLLYKISLSTCLPNLQHCLAYLAGTGLRRKTWKWTISPLSPNLELSAIPTCNVDEVENPNTQDQGGKKAIKMDPLWPKWRVHFQPRRRGRREGRTQLFSSTVKNSILLAYHQSMSWIWLLELVIPLGAGESELEFWHLPLSWASTL